MSRGGSPRATRRSTQVGLLFVAVLFCFELYRPVGGTRGLEPREPSVKTGRGVSPAVLRHRRRPAPLVWVLGQRSKPNLGDPKNSAFLRYAGSNCKLLPSLVLGFIFLFQCSQGFFSGYCPNLKFLVVLLVIPSWDTRSFRQSHCPQGAVGEHY